MEKPISLLKMLTVTTALRDKIRRRATHSAENNCVTTSTPASKMLLPEEDDGELEFERLRLIKAGSTTSSSSSGTTKAFSDTDSGISNPASSCESFQSEHCLPDPRRDVLYESFSSSTPAFDPEEDDFDIKLSRSLANLGIGAGRLSCISDVVGDPFCPDRDPEEDYYDNVGLVNFSNLDINLDEIGVDFDIVEPPPAFAECSPDNEIRQLVVDSGSIDVAEDESTEELGDRDANENEEQEDNNYVDECMKDLNGVLDNLMGKDSVPDPPVVLTSPNPANDVKSGIDGNDAKIPPPDSEKGKSRKSKKQKKKRERYEIRLGYPCYNLELEDRHVFIYALQKHRDMMEDLLGHSKLKNSKCNVLIVIQILTINRHLLSVAESCLINYFCPLFMTCLHCRICLLLN